MNIQHLWHDRFDSNGTGQSASGSDRRRQEPEYGQYREPEYGELASRYPNWNPYVYGEPDPEPQNDGGSQTANGRSDTGSAYDGGGHAYGGGPRPQTPDSRRGPDSYGNPYGRRDGYGYGPQVPPPGDPNDRSRYRGGIDLEDPNQNPLYGRWDPAAIISFVMALLSVPIVPLLLGGLSVYRTRLFRMKGRGLAIAAVIISLLTTALSVYLMATGMDPYQFVAQLYGFDYSGGTGGAGGSGDGSTSV
ncbi:hypothetical protein Uis1B_0980 [Bifidobacterium margollesii]|uniref:DUF4190 domain-containing protein n=1 Tax=Bifidobacterium margollesii TaxID=2020964 RepID=A0A2N5JAI8_9BIFI|nr:DUF4190 domain-containing protein [Bifidobacterium margollesii]PLS31236.1 hypothetical protein Uis1B_0980 [Bifidobacterium margollesii]